MGELFRGWRRKIGVATLAMACVFAVGWVRSFRVVDSVSFAKTQSTMTLLGSGPNGLGWSTIGHPFGGRFIKWESKAAEPHDYVEPARIPDGTLSSYGAFYLIAYHPPTRAIPLFSTLVVRYWSIVISLTLISPWLLVSKPRTSNRQKIVESTANSGA